MTNRTQIPAIVISADSADLPRRDGVERGPQRDDEGRRWRQEGRDRGDRAVGLADDREDGHEVADHRDHRDRGRRVRRLFHPRCERAEEPEGRRVEQVAEDEPDDQQRHRTGRRGRQGQPVRGQRGDERRQDEDEQLDDAQHADPEDLAHQQVARPDGRQDDLDDPALLLLDDAGQDAVAEGEDADEDEDRPDVGEQEARLVVLGLRVEGRDRRRLLRRRQASPGRRCSRRARSGRAAPIVAAEMIWATDGRSSP